MTSTHDDAAPASKSGDAAPAIVRVPFDAPWNWLAAGWRDLWATPQISLIYGGVFAGIAWFFLLALALSSALPLILPLAGGFLLLGPVLAVGLYEISRRRERGEATSWADISAVIRQNGSRLALFGVALLLLFIFWMRVAFLLFMLFFGAASYPSAETLVSTLLFTWHGLGLAIVGTAVGALFALVAYAISAISVPMLLDRHVDVVTAIIQSVQAVRTNPEAMLLWAALILGIVALGCLTLFVGLTIAFPLVGHASWHAYRELTGTR